MVRKKSGLGFANSKAIVVGGSLLRRCPAICCSSNRFWSNLPCIAKASKGDSAGGTWLPGECVTPCGVKRGLVIASKLGGGILMFCGCCC